MNREIEVKAKAKNLSKIRKQLEKLGCTFSDPIIQDDTIFVNFEGSFKKYPKGSLFLRIRKAKGKMLFTLKQPQKTNMDCIEKELEISNEEQMRGAIELLGYHEAVKVHKTRVKTRYNGTEICLDEVKGLGSFVEVEKMADGHGETIQTELFEFLKTLGVKPEDRVEHGYDALVYEKNHPGKE